MVVGQLHTLTLAEEGEIHDEIGTLTRSNQYRGRERGYVQQAAIVPDDPERHAVGEEQVVAACVRRIEDPKPVPATGHPEIG